MSDEAPEATAGGGVWRNRLRIGVGVLLGAAVVGGFWVLHGGGDAGSVASFQVSPGNPPVVFLYLNNVQVASYLAQLQGGAATTEVLSRQASETRNASVGSNGVGVGGSASEQSSAELSLTVNDQSRFTSLLGLLQADGFLHTVDMAEPDAVIRRQFAAVRAGSFVKLSDCELAVPSYVQAEQLWVAAKGQSAPPDLESEATQAFADRAHQQNLPPPTYNVPPVGKLTPAERRKEARRSARAASEMDRLVKRVGPNPRVPLSSCHGADWDANIPDLLMPIQLRALSQSQAALGGHVTLVGKVMLKEQGTLRAVGSYSLNSYADLASLQQWSGAPLWTSGLGGLTDDATLTGPGYLIQPIAIYR